MQSLKEKWENTLEILSEKYPPYILTTYISILSPKSFNEDEKTLYLVIEKPALIKVMNVRGYKKDIESAFSKVSSSDCKIEFLFPSKKDENLEKEEFSTTSTITPTFKNEYIFKPTFNFDNFVVGANNEFAHAAACAVADNPGKVYNPIFFYSAPGLGKTHLMHAIGHYILANNENIKVLYVSSEMFTNEYTFAIRNKKINEFNDKYRNLDVLLIDDVQFFEKKEALQLAFFNTFNALYEKDKQIVLSSDRPPSQLVELDERLRQRFGSNMVADMTVPDYETRMAILEKKAEIEGIDINNPDIQQVFWIISRKITLNVRELVGALERIIGFSKMMNEEINLDFAKKVLKDILNSQDDTISVVTIKNVVCKEFGITTKQIESKIKSRNIAYPRQIAMYLSREMTNTSLPKIGEMFGGRDHSTVLHACKKISEEIINNENTKTNINELIKKINS